MPPPGGYATRILTGFDGQLCASAPTQCTDARAAASDVDGVEFPESAGAINEYPIIVLKRAHNKAGAQAFIAYVQSDTGKSVLTAAGFQAP